MTYAALGFVMTILFVISGIGQAAAGFIVDRFGAEITMYLGLASLSIGAAVFYFSDTYIDLLMGALFVGVGNAVFHPVDYWILNHRVSVARLGPAFSAHGLSGSLGWACAPVFLVGIAQPFGWRIAVAAAGLLPLAMILVLLLQREIFSDAYAPPGTNSQGDSSAASLLGFLKFPAIWWCFVFFLFVSMALGGIQSFAPTIFGGHYELSLELAAITITVFMLARCRWYVRRRLARDAQCELGAQYYDCLSYGLRLSINYRDWYRRLDRCHGATDHHGIRFRALRAVTRHVDSPERRQPGRPGESTESSIRVWI